MGEEQSLSGEQIFKLVEIAEDWINISGSSRYRGRIGELNTEINCSVRSYDSREPQMVEISMENRGQLIGSIDSKDEKFRTLYKRIFRKTC